CSADLHNVAISRNSCCLARPFKRSSCTDGKYPCGTFSRRFLTRDEKGRQNNQECSRWAEQVHLSPTCMSRGCYGSFHISRRHGRRRAVRGMSTAYFC